MGDSAHCIAEGTCPGSRQESGLFQTRPGAEGADQFLKSPRFPNRKGKKAGGRVGSSVGQLGRTLFDPPAVPLLCLHTRNAAATKSWVPVGRKAAHR